MDLDLRSPHRPSQSARANVSTLPAWHTPTTASAVYVGSPFQGNDAPQRFVAQQVEGWYAARYNAPVAARFNAPAAPAPLHPVYEPYERAPVDPRERMFVSFEHLYFVPATVVAYMGIPEEGEDYVRQMLDDTVDTMNRHLNRYFDL